MADKIAILSSKNPSPLPIVLVKTAEQALDAVLSFYNLGAQK